LGYGYEKVLKLYATLKEIPGATACVCGLEVKEPPPPPPKTSTSLKRKWDQDTNDSDDDADNTSLEEVYNVEEARERDIEYGMPN
jgi:hypothetical protein